MADYFTPTVIQPTIPNRDMTPLECLVLTNILSAEPDGDGLYFFAEDCPNTMVTIGRLRLEANIAASKSTPSSLTAIIEEQLAELPPDAEHVDMDLSGFSWEAIFQDIVKRSATLSYVTAVSAFTCNKMRPDGFGGMAVLITADAIMGKSTNDIIEDCLCEAGLDQPIPQAPLDADGAHA